MELELEVGREQKMSRMTPQFLGMTAQFGHLEEQKEPLWR